MRMALNGLEWMEFARDERGAITVESILWPPVFILLLSIIADVSLVFHGQAKALRIAHDANREASTNVFATDTEIEASIAAKLATFSPNATVESTVARDTVATTIILPTDDLFIVGFLGLFSDLDISVFSLRAREI